MEYLSHSGAKRRSPRLRQREPRPTDPAPPQPCVFYKLTPQQPESALPRLTALFSTVAIEQPVNPLYFEPFPFSRLILNTFPHGYPRLLYSNLLGVTCPPPAHAEGMALFARRADAADGSHGSKHRVTSGQHGPPLRQHDPVMCWSDEREGLTTRNSTYESRSACLR